MMWLTYCLLSGVGATLKCDFLTHIKEYLHKHAQILLSVEYQGIQLKIRQNWFRGRRATSHYLHQCWLRCIVIWSQWVKLRLFRYSLLQSFQSSESKMIIKQSIFLTRFESIWKSACPCCGQMLAKWNLAQLMIQFSQNTKLTKLHLSEL